MAQETLRLVCLPVSAHDGRQPRQYTLEGQGAKKDISPPRWYGCPAAVIGKAGGADIDATSGFRGCTGGGQQVAEEKGCPRVLGARVTPTPRRRPQ
ncbi:hypothetical protein ZWY2020_035148 [Hordeum vulgare]|nr:hypothetical protein ZWY2020_035148 [Hordeum vulgare]